MKNIKYKLLKIISGIFYSRKYLCGKFFDTSSIGFKWVLKCWFAQKIQGINKQIPWPVSPGNTVVGPKENIEFCIDNLDNFQGTGVYFQCFAAKIHMGKDVLIANNVGLITANHDFSNVQGHMPGKDIFIGDNCWIGMNAVILPGVVLGKNTIVGAGSVVTKSFPEGNRVVAGNPAKCIRIIEENHGG
jgi:hypothetical protein